MEKKIYITRARYAGSDFYALTQNGKDIPIQAAMYKHLCAALDTGFCTFESELNEVKALAQAHGWEIVVEP
jgi:hypothetical protein